MTPTRATTIALDFDRTFTSDIPFWRLFVQHAVARGHKVYCVTGRHDTPLNQAQVKTLFGPEIYPLLAGAIFTNHESKRATTLKMGIYIDIWIDDMPEGVGKQTKRAFRVHEQQHKVYEELPVFIIGVVPPDEVWSPQ